MNFRTTAVAIVLNQAQQILVLRNCRNNYALVSGQSDVGTWKLPQGGIEANENVAQAIKRELFEETGLHVATEPPEAHKSPEENQKIFKQNYYSYYFKNSDRPDFEIRLYSVVVQNVDDQAIMLDQAEHDQYCWCTLAEFSTLNLGVRTEAYLQIIKDLEQFLQTKNK